MLLSEKDALQPEATKASRLVQISAHKILHTCEKMDAINPTFERARRLQG
jgi:hypothetical protein